MARGSSATSARQRAREAMAKQLARRRQIEDQIEQTVAAFYEAGDRVVKAREALAAAEAEQGAAVAALDALGQRMPDIAELCGITQAEARALRKASQGPAHNETPQTLDTADHE